MEYILVQDDDCHWYVIPANKENQWSNWLKGADADNWDLPDFAERIGGCYTLVKFKEYRIE